MAKTAVKNAKRAGKPTPVAAAAMSAALLLALGAAPREAEATFPGGNGKIAFASNRTAGEGVDNPEGDLEIFTMNPDGTAAARSRRGANRRSKEVEVVRHERVPDDHARGREGSPVPQGAEG